MHGDRYQPFNPVRKYKTHIDPQSKINQLFRIPILFTQNHASAGVQNGSLGELISIDQVDDVIGSVRLDTGETVDLQGGLIDALSLGYAMTLHKAQGSQFGRVIVLLQNTGLVDRSWIYTAITRAVSEVHIVGDPRVFKRFVEASPKAFRRKTMLTNLIDYLQSDQYM